MADYRFSATVIKRSDGKSAVAAAAYRAASNIRDMRTGQTCDYSRKVGVTHSEILAPDNTPEWMHDRAQLWNAVEAIERRKDAQLAREIQLSLPHELTDEQRRDLVRDFVTDQFISRGMVADLAIHAPNKAGDERNHHAHVMLTMRSLTAEGFGNKEREWNSTDQLGLWREQWAMHQNRALERHGHRERVDHRSYEAQGIDREPTAHLGPVASDMERNGKASRIGEQNRAAEGRNLERIENHLSAARIASDMARFDAWAVAKKAELENAQILTALDLTRKHEQQRERLNEQLHKDYGKAKLAVKAEIASLDRKLQAKGVRKLLRTVFGKTRTDSQMRQDMAASLRDIKSREAERRGALERRQAAERERLKEQQQERRQAQAKGIKRAEGRAKDESRSRHAQRPVSEPKAPSLPNPARDLKKATTRPPEPQQEPEPIERLSLADRKRIAESRIQSAENSPKGLRQERPWRAERADKERRPWRSKKPSGRDRSPDPKKP